MSRSLSKSRSRPVSAILNAQPPRPPSRRVLVCVRHYRAPPWIRAPLLPSSPSTGFPASGQSHRAWRHRLPGFRSPSPSCGKNLRGSRGSSPPLAPVPSGVWTCLLDWWLLRRSSSIRRRCRPPQFSTAQSGRPGPCHSAPATLVPLEREGPSSTWEVGRRKEWLGFGGGEVRGR